LTRHYGLVDVFSIAVGVMLSSGLFVLPGIAYAKAGPAMVLGYVLATILVIPTLLSLAELATAMPKSGGVYFFVERSVGPLAGTVTGFASWLAHIFKTSFALVGIGAIFTIFQDDASEFTVRAIAVGCCLLLSAFNMVYSHGSGRFQNYMVFVVLIILLGFTIVGVPAIDHNNYEPFEPQGHASVIAVAGLVFVAFGGLGKVADIAGEVTNPAKNIPRGLFLAYGTVAVLYVVIVFTIVGDVPPAVLLKAPMLPLTLAARALMGVYGGYLLGFGAFLAFLTAANAGILAASRTPVAMSRDGLLPAFFSEYSEKYNTPVISILITSAMMVTTLLLFSVEDVVKMASTMIILLFLLVNLAVVIMRKSGIQNYKPTFKSPLCPVIQVIAIVCYVILIAGMGSKPLALTQTFVLLAGVWYVGYVESRIDRESAFVYLVKSITDSNIGARSGLEDELRHIALERDGVATDRFDHLVKEAVVLDLKGQVTYLELFRRLAEVLEKRFEVDADHLYEHFIKREKESSTVILPGLAIPHVVIDDGENLFDIVLVRCREGIIFDEIHQPVKVCFALIGSPDERNYHLKALMNVAHIVQEDDFLENWLAANDEENLRDLVLLSGRAREKVRAKIKVKPDLEGQDQG
jgi:amino acid transporter/mannitol/fructose-specific phosphotransferase system IIA component (Ntr-type)